ncbi:sushi, von Willebrand factor type A, EGF and pentraxin domain-containing protein 1-like [Paramisgurnus dabryanus]|uniref:sushi, von Willebrand factor type A, EGF and pentraxin domain-containing protein 1-like n=1 Tax=Paramisgurnus dabryanus TaxID=90735 RepID=UPI0031F42AB6
MVTVSSAQPSAPQYVFGLSECGSGSDGFLTVGCIAKGFSPADSLTFKWTDPKGQRVNDFVQYPTIGREGDYTKISHLHVKKSDYTPDKPYKCEAVVPPTIKRLIKCNPEDVLTLHHGSIKCSGPNGKYSYDSVCEYSCEMGYELKGSNTTKCTATTEWTSKPPTCELLECSELTTPNNGTKHCSPNHDSKSYQSTCEFACDVGYTLRNSSSSTLLCEATGHWNDSQPSCGIVECNPEDVTTLHHGSVQCSHPNGNFSYESVCEYSCEEGYELKGSNTTKCTATTKWSSKPPTCELVQCSKLTTPNNGTKHCSPNHDSKSYQSTCEFACDVGYTLQKSRSSTLLCEATGLWNDSQPSCEIIKCNSDVVTTLHHGSVQCSHPNGNFSYDSVCVYSCEEGYELKGSNTTKCTATTEWTSKPPTCELIQCSELITPNNGAMKCHHDSKGNFSYQSTCEFACKEGYTLQTSISSTLLCEATGHWNDSQPSCEIVKCNPDDVLTLHHGSVQCSYPNGNFSYESVCEYSCEEGYELKGSNMTKCTATTEWTSKPPTCELVQCSELITPNNGTMQCRPNHDSKSNFSYQSTCEFACDEGYTLQTSSSSTLLCNATGHWNDSQPSCEIVKCNPEDVLTLHHGSVQCSKPNGKFSYDSVCEYSCEEGYELKGSSTTNCTATTKWTSKPPTCEFVQCSKLTTPNNGVMQCYDCNGKFSYKSTCEFACDKGYTLRTSSSSTLFCQATGHWSDSQPSCEIVKCNPEDVLTLHHGSVQCSEPNGNFSYDSVCEYSCQEGYELKGSNTTKCTATTEWTSKPPTCELVQCSKLTTPNNGAMKCHHESKSNFSYQSTCEFACKKGYTLRTSSSSTLLCGATGHWNDSQPSCEIVKCNPEDVLTLHHGKVQCSKPNGKFSYDSVCVYSCEEGYELKGSNTTKCTATTKWTSKPPTCELVQCSELTKPNNGVMQCYNFKGKFSYKSTCEFACEEGYTLQTSNSSTLLCGATGHWSDSKPSCGIVKCNPEDVTTLHHGSVQCSHPNGNFSYDSVCEYSCEEGYELKGCSSTNCTANTKWTSKPPTCELVQCPELTKPNNGVMHCHHDSKSNFSYQSTCEFACKEGYTLRTSSSSTLLCGARGHWNDSQPSCEIVKCNPEDVLTLHHGSVQCSKPNGKFSYDSVCEYSCEEGYELKGSNTRKCTATTEWTSKPPTCELVQCSELITPNNGAMQCYDFKGKFSYKSTCEFACDEGYTLQTSNSSTLLCKATGQWNDTQPSCEIIKCKPGDITTPDHGSVQCSEPNGKFSYDSVCEYSCGEGYELKGSNTRKCTSTTKWTGKPPTCELVQCSELTKPNNGTMHCHHDSKSNFSYQSTCEFACKKGYTLRTSSSSTLLCGATGHWNDSQPSCEIVKCNPEDVLTLHHGKVQCSQPNGKFSYDSVCEYSCEEGFELKGSNTRKCTATTKWTSKPPTCELVQCSKLITPNNGAMKCYDFKSKFSYKSTCEFACKEGYTLQTSSSSTLLCGATGFWNDSQPSCEIIKCKPGDIITPDHGSVQCSEPNGKFSYDSVCVYSCEEGYELKGSNTTNCTATTEWTSKPPTCEPPEPDQRASVYLTTPTNEELESGTATFICVAKHFFPEKHSFKWFHDDVEVKSEGKSDECVGKKKTNVTLFTATSILQIKSDIWTKKSGTKMKCLFEHKAGNEVKEMSNTAMLSLTLKSPIQRDIFLLSDVILRAVVSGNEHKAVEDASVSCEVEKEALTLNKAEIQSQDNSQFQIIYNVTVNRDIWFDGKMVTCTINDKNITQKITFNKGEKPSVVIYEQHSDNTNPSNHSLACEVSSPQLGDVYIMWRVGNEEEYKEGYTSAPIKQKDSTSVISLFEVSDKQYEESTISCAVVHANMDNTRSPLIITASKNEPPEPETGFALHCNESVSEEDEFRSLWSTATSFIFLFLFSLTYSALISLSKMQQ